MRYLGSKDSLAYRIVDLLREKGLLQNKYTFCDGFCGMGAVADAVKNTYNKIIINDSLKCASVFTHARLIANGCTFEKLGFDPFCFLNECNEFREGFIYQNYSPGASERMYFSKENAGRIDFFREIIEKWYESDKITNNEFAYLLACLLESVSGISNTAGVYGAFLKHWDKRALKPIIFNRIDSSPGIAKNIEVLNSRIEDIISDIDCDILYINDSKKLSAAKREELYDIIMEQAVATGLGTIGPDRIDEINILQATYEAMRQAIAQLSPQPDLLLNDAVTIPKVTMPQVPIIKGDAKSISIGAASIIAKVTRDRMMVYYDSIYPEYGFASNKGYGSAEHIAALKKYGPTPIHRRTFIKNFVS